MQLMIDISIETPAALRLAAAFLVDHAVLLEKAASEVREATPTAARPSAPPPPPPNVPAGTMPSNVTPFPVPAPPAPAATVPAAPSAPTSPSIPTTGTTTSVTGPLSTDELDSAGIPWDARIHQKAKSKKKDNTWKLQKGIAEATVAAVLQELQAQGRVRVAAGEVPAPPSFPVGAVPVPSVPGAPAAQPLHAQEPNSSGSLPVPSVATVGGVPVPSVTFPGSAVPVPPAPVLGVPDAPQPGVVQIGFRELVSKITAARGANRVTAEEVSGLVAQAGAPNLQTLGAMAHLVPVVDQLLDILLATR